MIKQRYSIFSCVPAAGFKKGGWGMIRSKSLLVFVCFALSFGFAQSASAQFGSFFPGTVEDPADPPDSSGGWPFGSNIVLIFSQGTFSEPPFNGIPFDGSVVPDPQVLLDCLPGNKDDDGNCKCESGIDLIMTGTAISVIADNGTLRIDRAASRRVLLARNDLATFAAALLISYLAFLLSSPSLL